MNLIPALAFLALLSFLLTLWQWVAGRRFRLRREPRPLRSGAPSVTILKPVKGMDEETEACLRSWLRQDYGGEVQVLLGVACGGDPVCEVILKLVEEHPEVDVELMICGESLGTNAKVSTLIQLERRARHETIVIADADVRVLPGFLAHAVGELIESEVDLVSCFYALANPTGWAMRWEAVAVNADFWSQVLQARSMGPIDFALGATMVTTRARVAAIGGFRVLSEYLADDFQLGRRMAGAGGKLGLSGEVVQCWMGRMSFAEVWLHQLRWARTIRASRPVSYFFSLLGNATLWPLLFCLVADLGTIPGMSLDWGVGVLVGCVAFRVWSGVDLQCRLTGRGGGWAYGWLVVVKDLLHVGIWAMSFLGNRVTWRGERFDVIEDGKLVSLRSTEAPELVAVDKPLGNS